MASRRAKTPGSWCPPRSSSATSAPGGAVAWRPHSRKAARSGLPRNREMEHNGRPGLGCRLWAAGGGPGASPLGGPGNASRRVVLLGFGMVFDGFSGIFMDFHGFSKVFGWFPACAGAGHQRHGRGSGTSQAPHSLPASSIPSCSEDLEAPPCQHASWAA